MNIITQLYWRLYFTASFWWSIVMWFGDGCPTAPKLATMGNAIGCGWRHQMARADWKSGLAPNLQTALKARIDRTEWYRRREKRLRAHDAEICQKWFLWVDGEKEAMTTEKYLEVVEAFRKAAA